MVSGTQVGSEGRSLFDPTKGRNLAAHAAPGDHNVFDVTVAGELLPQTAHLGSEGGVLLLKLQDAAVPPVGLWLCLGFLGGRLAGSKAADGLFEERPGGGVLVEGLPIEPAGDRDGREVDPTISGREWLSGSFEAIEPGAEGRDVPLPDLASGCSAHFFVG
ncbi:hypothetical protein M2440_004504 [Methylorubrum extorquens]|nr:hypothetical protein [Methylorubrum extorquens]